MGNSLSKDKEQNIKTKIKIKIKTQVSQTMLSIINVLGTFIYNIFLKKIKVALTEAR